MKKLKQYLIYNQNTKGYITEEQNFLIKNKNVLKNYDKYDYHPKTCRECINIIIELLKQGETDLNCIDVSNIKYMGWLFKDVNRVISVKEIDISEWDVSNVTNMQSMFENCNEFNADLSKWDVSKVKNMNYMFTGCKKFNSDLSHWNVKNVRYLISTFEDCSNFDSDLSNWDIYYNIECDYTFNRCTKLFRDDIIPTWWKDKE